MFVLRRWFAAILPAILVSGCVSYAPHPLVPDDELAALRSAGLDDLVIEHATPGDGPLPDMMSFDLADGLNEAELVAVALTLNRELRARRLEIGEAEALLVGAGLLPNPEVGVAWRGGIGGADGHSVDADLLMDLLQPWQREAREAVAAAHIETVRAAIVSDEWRLVRETRLRLLAVRAAVQIADMLDEAVGIRSRMLDLAQRSRDAGEGTDLDVSAAELELAEMQRDQRFALAEAAAARRDLNAQLGLPSEYELHLTDADARVEVAVFSDPTNTELEQRVLAGRHELRALEAAYEEAEQQLRLAVLGQYPSLKLGLGFERESEGDSFLGPAAGLEIPIFDRNQGEIAERLVARDRARANYVATLHQLRAEAYESRAHLRTARAEIEAQQRDVLPRVRRNQDLIERAFRAGELRVLDWVAAQQRALRARRTFLETLLRYQRGVIEVEAATGMPLSQPVLLPSDQQAEVKGTRDE